MYCSNQTRLLTLLLCRTIKPDRKSPLVSPACSPCSPNISVGPPQSPPSNPYTNLFNSGLYQQYLGQLLANSNNSNINPMLLQAQLAMASYNNHANLISERLKQNRFSPYSSPPVSSLANNIGSAGLASAFSRGKEDGERMRKGTKKAA